MIETKRNRAIFPFIVDKLSTAKHSIKLAVAWFTDPELSKLLLNKITTSQIDVEIILYRCERNLLLDNIENFGEKLLFAKEYNYSIMHHKFCVIDDEYIITGSYNWTIAARKNNKENVIGTNDKKVLDEFIEEFRHLKKVSEPQSLIIRESLVNNCNNNWSENLELLNLELRYNAEIDKRIKKVADMQIGINTGLIFKYVTTNTPVFAAKKLAEADNGQRVQNGLETLQNHNRLNLSFEESIIRKEFKDLFDDTTKRYAYEKLEKLFFFVSKEYISNPGLYIEKPNTLR